MSSLCSQQNTKDSHGTSDWKAEVAIATLAAKKACEAKRNHGHSG